MQRLIKKWTAFYLLKYDLILFFLNKYSLTKSLSQVLQNITSLIFFPLSNAFYSAYCMYVHSFTSYLWRKPPNPKA